ncbi:MFS transporter [Flammeovirgaceae bacterium SG7u.111]|nr:MFS transporter [Flammeovirgaceae bacterium SG7u.132]WPO38475.1 MFS transporter [Flammeovirgaceae bacterium SG7u.111]
MKILKSPWVWLPSLYFAEGLPYVIVNTLSVIMYTNLEIPNAEMAFYTSWLNFPWVIKPFWSPIVELLKTTRWWVVTMQFVLGVSFALVALTLPLDNFFRYTLAFFWLAGFSSATHDIAADGFYMEALNEGQQSFFVGIRNTFYRIAMVSGQGLVVILAGKMELIMAIKDAWLITMLVVASAMVIFSLYHKFTLPKDSLEKDEEGVKTVEEVVVEFFNVFKEFLLKKNILLILSFLLLYRLGEAQLLKIAYPFLSKSTEAGGLGLATDQIGFIYGTVGMIALTLGGILGGVLVYRNGLKYWFWWMMLAVNLPNLVYVFLAVYMPQSLVIISSAVIIEQFGYGLGFTAFVMYLILIAEGKHKTAHYAIGTGFMALGVMLPGMVSGYIQELLGYKNFFIWVVLCGLPAFVVAYFLKIDPEFGKGKK